MRYLKGKEFLFQNCVVTLGKFDGLHIGHRKIMRMAKDHRTNGRRFVVFTFDYHPGNLFTEREVRTIYTEFEKRSILEDLHPDVTISYPFTSETASMKPDDFVKEILWKRLDAKVVVVGADFHYGRNREGDAKLLRKLGEKQGRQIVEVEKASYNGSDVSSTRIREALSNGSLADVNHMLGEPYRIMGEVAHGKKLGKELFDTPTMNQIPERMKMLPPNGVYVSRARLNGREYDGVTNVGVKPSLEGEKTTTVETHLFGYEGDAYGENLEVSLLDFLRPERRFDSMDALKEQMAKDKRQSIHILASTSFPLTPSPPLRTR